MNGWIVHVYGYVPARANVREKVCPLEMDPESNFSGDGEREVTVWGTSSKFVHVTVAPVLTVTDPGLNSRPRIATAAASEGPAAPDAAGEDGGVVARVGTADGTAVMGFISGMFVIVSGTGLTGDGDEFEVHPATRRAPARARIRTTGMLNRIRDIRSTVGQGL